MCFVAFCLAQKDPRIECLTALGYGRLLKTKIELKRTSLNWVSNILQKTHNGFSSATSLTSSKLNGKEHIVLVQRAFGLAV